MKLYQCDGCKTIMTEPWLIHKVEYTPPKLIYKGEYRGDKGVLYFKRSGWTSCKSFDHMIIYLCKKCVAKMFAPLIGDYFVMDEEKGTD